MVARPKYQVFISSTYGDLRDDREAVAWSVLSTRHIPAGMENFTATDDRGWKTIKSVIDRSDYFVLILAGRYGTIDYDGQGWTEKEYHYAISKGIPVLAFIRSEKFITVDKQDKDAILSAKLNQFKQLVKEKHLCSDWMSKEDLVRHVSSALQNHIIDDEDTDMRRPGWFRGNELPDIGTMDEFARLSSENAKLKDEIESLKFSVGSGPCVTIVDMNEVPLPPEEIVSKKLKVNSSIHDSITKMASDVKGNSGEILGINIMKILELGIKNTGSTLIEHVIVDLTLNHIIGFRCGWEGLLLVSREGYLTNYVVKKELQNMYSEVTRFIPPDNIYMRYRIPRVPIGGTEYLPHLFVLGSIEGEKSSFILKYKIVGSMVMPIEGSFLYEIKFNDSEVIGSTEKMKELDLIRKRRGDISIEKMFLKSWII